MLLKGSCHCGAIRFEVESAHPYPYNLCYCSVCRKTAGGGGFAINLGAASASALWLYDPRWPQLLHPFASAIDSELPRPPERTHLMLGSKAGWVEPAVGADDRCFDEYPDESIAEWHERLRLTRD